MQTTSEHGIRAKVLHLVNMAYLARGHADLTNVDRDFTQLVGDEKVKSYELGYQDGRTATLKEMKTRGKA